MRLIDADALKNKMLECSKDCFSYGAYGEYYNGKEAAYLDAADLIDEAPTVEERKQGRWKNGCCTVCGESAATDGHFDFIPEEAQKYCWNCGAIMDGEPE